MRVLEQLLGGLRRVCASIPDGRQWRLDNMAIADAGMAAFSLFFMRSESFLSHQRRIEHGRNGSNRKTLFGGRVLIALDGSEYFSSEKRGCPAG